MSPTEAIIASAKFQDWSSRVVHSETVVASPSGSAETIIAQITVQADVTIGSGVSLSGWAAYTVGTSGTAGNLRIRQTNVSGTVVVATGALTGNHGAGVLVADDVNGFDASPPSPRVYVLTLTVTAGAAASTVSAVELLAVVV